MNNLDKIATILRRDSLEMTTAAGSGHPTSCLSCAEIIASLFFQQMKYDTKNADNLSNDVFILSKGHAAPILYAALYRAGAVSADLLYLRKPESPYEGHPLPQKFPWAKVATGSLGQGISNAVGIAISAKIRKQKNQIYTLLGDGEIAEGSVYEAIQLAVHRKLDNLTIIIDVNRLGQSKETLYGHNIAAYKKRFEGFGCKVVQVNGHSIEKLLKAYATKRTGPLVILAKTFKGNGISFLKNKEGKHGNSLSKDELKMALKELPKYAMPKIKIKHPPKFSLKKSEFKPTEPNYVIGDFFATRSAYGAGLVNLNASDIISLDGETSNSTGAETFAKKFPDQYIESYIAEQNMAGMAAGLATQKFVPFVSTFGAFLARAHDQIRITALGELPVTFVGSHSGVSIGEDGPSQMALGDLAFFRALPKSVVLYPSDAVATEKLVQEAYKQKGVVYLRTSRPKTPVIYKNVEKFPLGGFKTFSQPKDKAAVVTAGITLHEALNAQKLLAKKNVFVSIVDCYSVKPFDTETFKKFLGKKKLVVIEDHYPEGGIGEMLAGNGFKIDAHTAVTDIPHSGPEEYLLKQFNLDAESIAKTILRILR